MRETLRVDLAEGLVRRHIGEENLFETVESAVGACLDRMQAAKVERGGAQEAQG